jgi:hypothetical protein
MIDTPANVATQQTRTPRTPPEEILSLWHLEILSKDAVKLFVAVWEKMHERNITEIWMDDVIASRRARVALKDIPAAQSELARARLFGMIPGIAKVRYTFEDTEAE